MKRVTLLPVAAVAAVAGVVVVAMMSLSGCAQEGAAPQAAGESAASAPRSAREVRGHTPYFGPKDEPPPKLIVDEPLPEGLPQGIVWIQYRTENCRLLPLFGKEALKLSPRVGHLHVRVDDLPWGWADSSDNNTVDVGGMPPGEHKITIDLVDSMHQTYPGQSRTVKFTIPKSAAHAH